ncbi:TetR/AcrR family transcriptional regulator [Flavobacterium selenitireducens]|uniref:TetR/AcrR family transcriptional regulator n=1 Tax=Flavobacterium selenitireducens TaxID=2722704 RepID=UPI00168BD08B|nr:TetR/AcrR family transcriptional regulator [Flavobacterium selenitireducens]MBD3581335.1 TetR/AcrR family transcriptional regulator [Flavobacterium selenitireducens]
MGKAEVTRQFIIEKSAPIFNKFGYAGTSMQDLTRATGLTKGSIYGNFANKDEVALEAFKHNVGKMSAFFESEMSQVNGYREKLLVYPKTYDAFFTGNFIEGGCPVLNTSVESDDTHPALKAQARKAFLNWKQSIANLIELGKEKGEFESSVNAESAAFTILALIEGGTMIAKLTEKEVHMQMITSHLTHFIETL